MNILFNIFRCTFTVITASALLISCSQDHPTSIDTASPQPSSEPAQVLSLARSDLPPYQMVMIFPSGNVPKDLPDVEQAINDYLLKKINATIEIRPIDWSVWQDKTNLMFTSNEQFDLMFTSSWYYLGQEVTKQQIIPLDKLLKEYGQGITSTLEPAYLESGRVKGSIYGVVTNKEFASTKGIVMRKDLVDKYHIDLSPIHSLEDFSTVLKTIKDNEPDLIPLQVKYDRSPLTVLLGYGEFDMLDTTGGPGVLRRDSDDLKVINMYETEEYAHYAKLMHEWFQAGYINKDGSITRQDEFEAVKAGKAFAYAESMKPGFDAQESRNTGYPMVTVELTKPYTTTGDTTSAMFAIPRTSKDPARAMMFLNLLYSDPYLLNLLDWGIEGKHYVKKSDTIIDYPPGETAKSIGYNLNLPWMFGNEFNSYIWASDDPKLWDKYRSFNQNAEISKALGFVFDPSGVKNEVIACNNVLLQYTGAINAGEFEPSQILPTFIKALHTAGADKIISEKQRQLDEWAASRNRPPTQMR
ncbi:ABC transporter substrate-binding protein [Paenibacillus hexagrammi]|uniref:ABC transporter substrate-binding protein n=1 Tax=Paenibacillus hexagrammi TaxID=2908839 RepID=A0ABY3SLY6_9BACL|nr:ABC transporter substrate-binding protein [Paenibacillus sp. YPD9-1]UJF34961.1 ABC transporter substrate-binding protein [Paenibacillus sp. YPD9-1]